MGTTVQALRASESEASAAKVRDRERRIVSLEEEVQGERKLAAERAEKV